jgi:hypothetical protein
VFPVDDCPREWDRINSCNFWNEKENAVESKNHLFYTPKKFHFDCVNSFVTDASGDMITYRDPSGLEFVMFRLSVVFLSHNMISGEQFGIQDKIAAKNNSA